MQSAWNRVFLTDRTGNGGKVRLSFFITQWIDFTCFEMSLPSLKYCSLSKYFTEVGSNISRNLTCSVNLTYSQRNALHCRLFILFRKKCYANYLDAFKNKFVFRSIFTINIWKVLNTTIAGTKHHQQTSNDSQLYFPHCILLWLRPAKMKAHQHQQWINVDSNRYNSNIHALLWNFAIH